MYILDVYHVITVLKKPALLHTKKSRYKVWLTQAKYDLEASKLSAGNGYHEWACFQAEQSAEKALKSVLVQAGWRPPKMHKLSVLISYCNKANDKFFKTKFQFRDLESFTFISRYPFLIPGNHQTPHDYIQKEDSIKCISQAEGMYQSILQILEGEAKLSQEMEYESQKAIDVNLIKSRIDNAVDRLIHEFNPHKLYLFGSYARGEHKPGSTVDLMVIIDTNLRFLDRINEAIRVVENGMPSIEPLVYTPEEFEYLCASEGFFQTAMEESKLLYENGQKVNWQL